jgi:hypothetical protein
MLPRPLLALLQKPCRLPRNPRAFNETRIAATEQLDDLSADEVAADRQGAASSIPVAALGYRRNQRSNWVKPPQRAFSSSVPISRE